MAALLVAWVAANLRQHGPSFLGHLAQSILIPARGEGELALTPPVLASRWEALCKGDLVGLKIESLYYEILAHAGGESVVAPKIPDEQHYTHLERLRADVRLGVPFFAGIGFPSDEASFAGRTPKDLFDACVRYHEDSTKLRPDIRSQRSRKAVLGCL